MRKKKQQDTEAVEKEQGAPDVETAEKRLERKAQHFVAKIVCLLAAAAVWMYVMNMETTDFERVFSQVPVMVDGVVQLSADSDMSVISGYSNTVDVIVSGKKSDVLDLTADDIRVSVDVSELNEAGKFTLPVNVQLPDNFRAVNESLLSAEIYVDVDTTREIPVRITKLEYIRNSSDEIGEPELSHETITVTGPQQVLELIECAALEFDLGNVTTSTIVVGTPKLVDADGMPISNPYVRFANSEITVNIPVQTEKTIKLTYGYAVPEMINHWMIDIVPATVSVVGDPMLLAQLDTIEVYQIAADARAGEYVISASAIDLPAGVSLKDPIESFTVQVHQIVG